MPIADLSGLYIELVPVVLPAFSQISSFWLDYDALKAERITTLRTTPVITAYHMSGINMVCIHCRIEDEAFCHERHGLPYGDTQFAQEINDHLRKALRAPGLPAISYADHQSQRGNMVALDAGYEWSLFLETLSHHRLLEMTGWDSITALHLGPLSWGKTPQRPD